MPYMAWPLSISSFKEGLPSGRLMVSRTEPVGSQRHALAVRTRQQALRDDALQGVPQALPQIVRLAVAERDDAVHGSGDVGRVQRGQHEVAGLGGLERDVHGLRVSDFTHLDDVRILAQRRAQRAGKALRVVADFPFGLPSTCRQCKCIRSDLRW